MKQRMKYWTTIVLRDRLALDQSSTEWDACYIQGTNLDSVSVFAVQWSRASLSGWNLLKRLKPAIYVFHMTATLVTTLWHY
jgi:hypothetical protein